VDEYVVDVVDELDPQAARKAAAQVMVIAAATSRFGTPTEPIANMVR
jgi:hypothetical protein